MNHRERQRLTDIADAIAAIESHLSRGDLSDGLIFDAVRIRLLEIGEAVTAISAATTACEPDIPGIRSPVCATTSHTATSTPATPSCRPPSSTTFLSSATPSPACRTGRSLRKPNEPEPPDSAEIRSSPVCATRTGRTDDVRPQDAHERRRPSNMRRPVIPWPVRRRNHAEFSADVIERLCCAKPGHSSQEGSFTDRARPAGRPAPRLAPRLAPRPAFVACGRV